MRFNMKREIKALTEADRRKLHGTNISLHVRLNNPHKDMGVIKVLPNPKVLGYVYAALLENCTMRIHDSARRKVAAGANRSVHCWILGTYKYVTDESHLLLPSLMRDAVEIHYNPKRDASFVLHNGGAIETAKRILFWYKRIYLIKG